MNQLIEIWQTMASAKKHQATMFSIPSWHDGIFYHPCSWRVCLVELVAIGLQLYLACVAHFDTTSTQ